jgi:uncharacterized protein YggT (Ycf19 family)
MYPVIVETPHRPANRVAFVARIGRVFDYLFGVLYSLLLVRLALEFFGARQDAGFFRMVNVLTEPFYAPFKGLFATRTIDGARFVWPLVVAIVAYMLLHAAIRGLLRLVARG